MMKPRDNAIHILYAMSDKKGTYAKFLGSSMFSVMENTEARLVFHIFEDGTLSEENRTKLQEIVRGHRQTLKIYNVKQQLADVWQRAAEIFTKATSSARYTEAALYRLVAPRVLPENIHRLIYLDADTIVHLDIRGLWQERLGLSRYGSRA
jgi:lipopolysaccharide biosynthesis glycosyltransferase